jgi:hypothetical protein
MRVGHETHWPPGVGHLAVFWAGVVRGFADYAAATTVAVDFQHGASVC